MTTRTQEQAIKYALSMVGYGRDFEGSWGWQCFDTVNFYWYYLYGHGLSGAYAKDIPFKNNFKGEATVYKNTPSFLAKKGDVFVMGANRGNGAGHTGIVVSATLNSITVVEQNWLGGGATFSEVTTKRTHPYDTEMWFIRPNFAKPKKKEKAKKVVKKVVKKATPKKKEWTFKVGGAPIITRIGKPSLKATTGGSVKPNQTMIFNKLVKKEGYEWGMLTNFKGQKEYVPIRPLSKSRNVWGVLK